MIRRYLDYLRNNPQGYWFKAKWYGWGWVPVRWQGWLVVAAYIIAVLSLSLTINEYTTTREIFFSFILPVTLLTVLLIVVCYKTGEKPGWHWGNKK